MSLANGKAINFCILNVNFILFYCFISFRIMLLLLLSSMESLGFSTQILSVNNGGFISFLPIYVFLFCTSLDFQYDLNRHCGENMSFLCFWSHWEGAQFLTIKYDVRNMFFIDVLHQVEEVFLFSYFAENFNHWKYVGFFQMYFLHQWIWPFCFCSLSFDVVDDTDWIKMLNHLYLPGIKPIWCGI